MNPGDLLYSKIISEKWSAGSLIRAILPLFQIAGIKISDRAIQFMSDGGDNKYITNEDSNNEAQKNIISNIEATAYFITEFRCDLQDSYFYFRQRSIYMYYFLLFLLYY